MEEVKVELSEEEIRKIEELTQNNEEFKTMGRGDVDGNKE